MLNQQNRTPLVSTAEAHADTGISIWLLNDWARRGDVPAGVVVRVGRRRYWNLDRLRAHLDAGGDLARTAPPVSSEAPVRSRSS